MEIKRSANKCTKNVSIASSRVPINNGFGPLSETSTQADIRRVDNERKCSYDRSEGRPQSYNMPHEGRHMKC